jgi:uncharacterized protein YecT (DUF1311 family)
MWKAIFLSLAVVNASPCFSQAQEIPNDFPEAPYGASKGEIAEALKDCNDAIGEMTIQICAWDGYRQEEVKYRRAAQDAISTLQRAEDRASLIRANHAFEQFRTETCDFDSRGNGSMAGSLLFGCLERYTRRRADALRAFADCAKTANCQLPNILYAYEIEDLPRNGQQ